MGAFQMCGCLSAVFRAVITGCLLTAVRGDGEDSKEELDITYALIGAGIGLLLAAGFIIIKLCLMRRHVGDDTTALPVCHTLSQPIRTSRAGSVQ
ncbi:transmembrane protein 273-like [Cheilinus undulatus]|uniref:transmembrane protein 273-like n=1 Tax=Cheilinus undulatus TaxID=241271 RepID=UPI001BD34A28|nr:transmembrane protein 273-like [Cheilinus undulatus]